MDRLLRPQRIHLHLLQDHAYKEHVSSHCIQDSVSAAHVEEHSMNHQENINPWGKMSEEVVVNKKMNRHTHHVKIT